MFAFGDLNAWRLHVRIFPRRILRASSLRRSCGMFINMSVNIWLSSVTVVAADSYVTLCQDVENVQHSKPLFYVLCSFLFANNASGIVMRDINIKLRVLLYKRASGA